MAEQPKKNRKVSGRETVCYLLLLVFGCGALSEAQASPVVPCYAFLKGNAYQASDLYTACEGENKRITTTGDVWDFAVAADGSALALRRPRGTEQVYDVDHRPIKVPHFEFQVVSLKANFQARWTSLGGKGSLDPHFATILAVGSLHPYCGTILSVERHFWDPSLAREVSYDVYDPLRDQPLTMPPYIAFGCSSDKKAVLGYLDADLHALWTGLPPKRKIEPPAHVGIILPFDISPNGQYIAYAFEPADSALCVDKDEERVGCLRGLSSSAAKVSVSDTGDVLYDGGTGETCNGWQCMGIFYWRPGSEKPEILQPVGWFAQWISPQTAAALRAWGSRVRTSTAKDSK